jgi:hypothetical protein
MQMSHAKRVAAMLGMRKSHKRAARKERRRHRQWFFFWGV